VTSVICAADSSPRLAPFARAQILAAPCRKRLAFSNLDVQSIDHTVQISIMTNSFTEQEHLQIVVDWFSRQKGSTIPKASRTPRDHQFTTDGRPGAGGAFTPLPDWSSCFLAQKCHNQEPQAIQSQSNTRFVEVLRTRSIGVPES
jgi:hypothetical protein